MGMYMTGGKNVERYDVVIGGADIPRYRYVAQDGTLCGLDEKAWYVTAEDVGAGLLRGLIVKGEITVESGGAFSAGAILTSDASGRAIENDTPASKAVNGYAVTASTGTGQAVTVRFRVS